MLSPSFLHWHEITYRNTKLAQLIVANGGAVLTGAAGVGKTMLLKEIKQAILEQDPDAHIVTMALRHVAARLAQGCTISHALRKFSKLQNAWIIGDECSEVPLSMLGEISRWGLVGCKFILPQLDHSTYPHELIT